MAYSIFPLFFPIGFLEEMILKDDQLKDKQGLGGVLGFN